MAWEAPVDAGLEFFQKGIMGIIWYNEYREAPGIVIAFVNDRCSMGVSGRCPQPHLEPHGVRRWFCYGKSSFLAQITAG